MPRKPQFILTDEVIQAIDRQFKIHGNLADALRAIGLERHYSSISKRFAHLEDRNPYVRRSAAKRYELRTGETVMEAIEFLASSHTRKQIAEMLGFPSDATMGKWLKAQGASVEYNKRKIPDRRPITDHEAERWLLMREEGMKASEAAEHLGRDEHRLRLHAYAMFPDRCAAVKRRYIR